jgi:acetyl esterase/lipase
MKSRALRSKNLITFFLPALIFPLSILPQTPSLVVQTPSVVRLWPAEAPGTEKSGLIEHVVERSADPAIRNRSIDQITEPVMEIFVPEKHSGIGILICPGGGYSYLAYDKEGVDIAQWLNSIGVTAFLLKYRLPGEDHIQTSEVPLQDAQRAMRIIRTYAVHWDIDSNKIGIMGFSAGGHLAATLGTSFNRESYIPEDLIDKASARPDFMVLLYPVTSMDSSITHAGSKANLIGNSPAPSEILKYSCEKQVTAATPEAFIALAADDTGVNPKNSLFFFDALRKAGVSAEIHIFERGGHGFGIRGAEGPVSAWTDLCEAWLYR